MRFLLEFDGLITDPAPVYYQTYRDAAAAVGWARVDQSTFWRLFRAQGMEANILPGAKPPKIKQYQAEFDARIEKDETIATYKLHPNVDANLATLLRFGSIVLVTLGHNLAARKKIIDANRLAPLIADFQALSLDPRRRPAELKALAAADPRAVVVASTDTLLRSADAADLLTVGVASGICFATRLHRAGAKVAYAELVELADSLKEGGKDLIQAGLPPLPIG